VDADKALLANISYPKAGEGVYIFKDILSRKKQHMPTVFELMKKAKEKLGDGRGEGSSPLFLSQLFQRSA